jgi:hypothetical protein
LRQISSGYRRQTLDTHASSIKGRTRVASKKNAALFEKIAHMTNGAKNRPQDKAKNRPQDRLKNRPDIINPVPLLGVVADVVLKDLLKSKGQTAWCSRVRLLGLLLLIDYICRNLKKGAISISADLAHSFVSKLRKRKCNGTVSEPLLLLCEIGILRRIRPAVFAHVKTSAVYCFTDFYRKAHLTLKVVLTPKLARKRASADDRRESRLNRKYPFRKQLLVDLSAVSFSPLARPIIARELSGNSYHLRALITAIDGGNHFARVSVRGQITTSIGSCHANCNRTCCCVATRSLLATFPTRIGIFCHLSLRTVFIMLHAPQAAINMSMTDGVSTIG